MLKKLFTCILLISFAYIISCNSIHHLNLQKTTVFITGSNQQSQLTIQGLNLITGDITSSAQITQFQVGSPNQLVSRKDDTNGLYIFGTSMSSNGVYSPASVRYDTYTGDVEKFFLDTTCPFSYVGWSDKQGLFALQNWVGLAGVNTAYSNYTLVQVSLGNELNSIDSFDFWGTEATGPVARVWYCQETPSLFSAIDDQTNTLYLFNGQGIDAVTISSQPFTVTNRIYTYSSLYGQTYKGNGVAVGLAIGANNHVWWAEQNLISGKIDMKQNLTDYIDGDIYYAVGHYIQDTESDDYRYIVILTQSPGRGGCVANGCNYDLYVFGPDNTSEKIVLDYKLKNVVYQKNIAEIYPMEVASPL